MQLRSFTFVPDHVVLLDLRTNVLTSNLATARLLELMAVVDERRLHAVEGHDSMLSFCIGDLHMSEDSARKRIQAARAAQRCPALLPAVAEGRLHLSAVVMLAPHLTPQNVATLIAESTHRTKDEIAVVLAQHFPRPDLAACIEVVPRTPVFPITSGERVPEPVQAFVKPNVPARVEPRSARRFAVQFMLDEAEVAELRHAQELAARLVHSTDLAAFYKWAVREVIKAQEKRQFAATSRPRTAKASSDRRLIPAHVKRGVRARDQRRCAFVSDSGKRCEAKRFLDFDHISPIAAGGTSTAENVRLLCSAHNQLEAERRFGKGFMARKRQEARSVAAQARGEVEGVTTDVTPDPTSRDLDHAAIRARRDEVVLYLRALKFTSEEARLAAAVCDDMHGASREARVKFAIQQCGRARFVRSTVCPADSVASKTRTSNPVCASPRIP